MHSESTRKLDLRKYFGGFFPCPKKLFDLHQSSFFPPSTPSTRRQPHTARTGTQGIHRKRESFDVYLGIRRCGGGLPPNSPRILWAPRQKQPDRPSHLKSDRHGPVALRGGLRTSPEVSQSCRNRLHRYIPSYAPGDEVPRGRRRSNAFVCTQSPG